ncbi:TonB-dependent receptor [Pedobacter caeni]|uniref:Outer membrane receptor for ferrienterochelin and colicins n=1 Tax=Pedobacter caeni TaxID=288992 RepID=A0A1M4YZB8_9SPHI|nr:TonB-dependent receptor [Pedobacter caeni]SHF11154.1 outer membrane receptor for ferrienterochelin and colicins [Pedobacter caeni]
MKRLLLPILLFISALATQGQEKEGAITGKVNTADGAAAANVMVFLKGLNRIVYTSEKGTFRISAPQGNQLLIVQSNTRKQIEVPVSVTAGQQQEIPLILLKESGYDLKEVVITGLYEPQSIRNSVYNIRTINSEMIRLRGATDLKAILSTELGFRFTNDPATGISNPQMMGMDVSSSGVKILLDGVPMMDRGTERESLGQIDVNTVERIEIIEGPMSVVYGTDAMAGVINIITKRGGGDHFSVTARIQEETAGKEYQAFKDKGVHNEYLNVNWQKNGWHIGGSGTRNNFGGWKGNQTGRQNEWLPKDQWLTSATTGFKSGKMDVWYRFNGADETLSYFGPVSNSPKVSDKKYLSKRWFHQLQGSFILTDKLTLDAAAAYTDYSRRTLSTDTELSSGKETLSTEPGSQDKDILGTAFFRSALQYKLLPGIVLQPGIEFNRNSGKGGRFKGEPVINDYAFFLTGQIQLNKFIHITPGFRLLKNSVYDAPPIIPSLHAKLRLDKDMDLRLSYARGFRAPTIRELYFYFKDASHDLSGNENLKAEYSNTYQASLSWNLRNTEEIRLNTLLSGFFNEYKDLIGLMPIGETGTVNQYMNIARYKTTGAEWNTRLSWKAFQASLGLSYIGTYNQYTEDKDRFGDLNEFVWTPEVSSHISYLIPKIGTNVSLYYKFTGKKPMYVQDASDANKVILSKIASFHVADLTLNKIVNKYLTINAGVKNVFDVTRLRVNGGQSGAHTSGGSNPYGVGRSYFLGLTMHWSKN